MMKNEAFNYTIEKHFAVLSQSGSTTKELNLVRYGDGAAKYDIRSWKRDGDSETMYKGITLTPEEAKALKDALNGIDEL